MENINKIEYQKSIEKENDENNKPIQSKKNDELTRVNLRLNKEIKNKLIEISSEKNISINNFINDILEEYLNKKKKEKNITKDDYGRLIFSMACFIYATSDAWQDVFNDALDKESEAYSAVKGIAKRLLTYEYKNDKNFYDWLMG